MKRYKPVLKEAPKNLFKQKDYNIILDKIGGEDNLEYLSSLIDEFGLDKGLLRFFNRFWDRKKYEKEIKEQFKKLGIK